MQWGVQANASDALFAPLRVAIRGFAPRTASTPQDIMS